MEADLQDRQVTSVYIYKVNRVCHFFVTVGTIHYNKMVAHALAIKIQFTIGHVNAWQCSPQQFRKEKGPGMYLYSMWKQKNIGDL